MKIWITYGTTESGDDWFFLSKFHLSDEQVVSYIKIDPWLAEEYEAGCIQGWATLQEEVID